ncbi:hypothetical protein CYMTET_37226, partial [Cymbomonas tetramitiformis]
VGDAPWGACIAGKETVANRRWPRRRSTCVLDEAEGIWRQRGRRSVDMHQLLGERIDAATMFMEGRGWVALPPARRVAQLESGVAEEVQATTALERFLANLLEAPDPTSLSMALENGVLEYICNRVLGLLDVDGCLQVMEDPDSGAEVGSQSQSDALRHAAKQAGSVLALLCQLACVDHHCLLAEITRRGAVEPMIRGLLAQHHPVSEAYGMPSCPGLLRRVLCQVAEQDLWEVAVETRSSEHGQAEEGGSQLRGVRTRLAMSSGSPLAAQGPAYLLEVPALEKGKELSPSELIFGVPAAAYGLGADLDLPLKGRVLLVRARLCPDWWTTQCAIASQAATLVWYAAQAGAVGVVFLWPGPWVRPLWPHPNLDVASTIPSYIIPATHPSLGRLLDTVPVYTHAVAKDKAPQTPDPPLPLDPPPLPCISLVPAPESSAHILSHRCGELLEWIARGGHGRNPLVEHKPESPAAVRRMSKSRALLRSLSQGVASAGGSIRPLAGAAGRVGGMAVGAAETALCAASVAAGAAGTMYSTTTGAAGTVVGAAANSVGMPLLGATARVVAGTAGFIGGSAINAAGATMGLAGSGIGVARHAVGAMASYAPSAKTGDSPPHHDPQDTPSVSPPSYDECTSNLAAEGGALMETKGRATEALARVAPAYAEDREEYSHLGSDRPAGGDIVAMEEGDREGETPSRGAERLHGADAPSSGITGMDGVEVGGEGHAGIPREETLSSSSNEAAKETGGHMGTLPRGAGVGMGDGVEPAAAALQGVVPEQPVASGRAPGRERAATAPAEAGPQTLYDEEQLVTTAVSAGERRHATLLLVALGRAPLLPRTCNPPSCAQAEAAESSQPQPVRILAIDGGGTRGIAAISMLRAIRQLCGAHHITHMFDLIVGTSTGGIIAVGCALGLTDLEIEQVYRESAVEAFQADSYTSLMLNGPGCAAARGFESILMRQFGPAAGMALGQTAAHLGCPRICLLSNLASRTPSATYLFRNYIHPSPPPPPAPSASPVGVGAAGTAQDQSEGRATIEPRGTPGKEDSPAPGCAPRRNSVDGEAANRDTPAGTATQGDYAQGEETAGAEQRWPASQPGPAPAEEVTGARYTEAAAHNPVTFTQENLPGEHRASIIDCLRSTSAAPWYFEEVSLCKELTSGQVIRKGDTKKMAEAGMSTNTTAEASTRTDGGSPAEADPAVKGSIFANLRLIDGGISANNPADVAVHEARRVFGQSQSLVLVSVGTGSSLPAETNNRSLPGRHVRACELWSVREQKDMCVRACCGACGSRVT